MKIEMICKECGEHAKADKTRSSENFTVYETKCRKCEGQIVPKLK